MKMKCLRCGSKDFTQVFEQPELITLAEALAVRKDVILLKYKKWSRIIRYDENGFYFDGTNEKVEFHDFHLIEKEWQVIPVKPRILSQDEIIERVEGCKTDNHWRTSDIVTSIIIAEKNGEFIDRERTQPLIDAVGKYINDPDVDWHISGIIDELEKLKSLEDKQEYQEC